MKPQTTTKLIIPIVALTSLFIITHVYFFPYFLRKSSLLWQIGHRQPENRISSGGPESDHAVDYETESPFQAQINNKTCDLFTGEWVPNPEGPYYTNATCDAIHEHQNCLKHGRPDTEFMKWRWKPDECELPVFDPRKFLEIMRGKSLAFIGDSIARNQMQSVICLLSRVARPVDVSKPTDHGNSINVYEDYNCSISFVFSPYLVRTTQTDPTDDSRPFNLFLDEYDETWTSRIHTFDFVVISAGHWFPRPSYYHLNRTLIGCLYCSDQNMTQMTSQFSYRRAFRTAFRAITGAGEFAGGVVFLRTYAPSHYEGGAWNEGGDCKRTEPYGRNGTELDEYGSSMYRIQMEEMRTARRVTGGKKVIRVFDATKAALLRPDGHPSKYGYWPGAVRANDCIHWCLPGPIDAWNDMLQELLSRESGV